MPKPTKCPLCRNARTSPAMGTCRRCGAPTSSRQYQLCIKCTVRSGNCMICGKPVDRELSAKEQAQLEQEAQATQEVLKELRQRRAKKPK